MNLKRLKILNLLIVFGAIFMFSNFANAQSYTQSEQACFDAVQGKVAWNKAGNKQWENAYVRRLCQGATNPSATISCFQNELKDHDNFSRAIGACKANQCENKTSTIKFGSLSKYYSDGCSCSAVPVEEFGKNVKYKAIFELPIGKTTGPAYINIGGVDTKYTLLKRVGKWQSKSWTEIYESNGSVLKIDYVFYQAFGESTQTDEGDVYDINLSLLQNGEVGVIEGRGTCGC
jgi:hypothetical protein